MSGGSNANNKQVMKQDSKDRPLLNTSPADLSDSEGACFLCLEGDLRGDPLAKCCTRCNALTHQRCWHEYRYNQRVASLRSRMLRESLPRSQMVCSICKTGEAKLAREDAGQLRSWMFLSDERDRQQELPDFNDESQDLVDVGASICNFKLVLCNLLLLVVCGTITALIFAHSRNGYSGDYLMTSVVVAYESILVQVVALFVYTRRRERLQAMQQRRLPGGLPT
ncbi:unnamed protein product [Amoebophrya sp. A25]|nr:unnamed protein product [Amoebophrya sp. A25]|eukprot:GSA25T00009213001.1